MTDALPGPLVSADADVGDMPGFLLNVNRLLSSELVALCTPEEGWAALMLWARAWQQTPPASLPNDDRILSKFSGAGKDWPRVREMALRGFVLCSDGRLYHRVLAEEANNASQKRAIWRAKRAAANERMKRMRDAQRDAAGDADVTRHISESDANSDAAGDAIGARHRTPSGSGSGSGSGSPSGESTRAQQRPKRPMPADFGISPAVRAWAAERGYTELEVHLEAFRNKAYANGYQYADWDRGFMEAIRANWAGVGKNGAKHGNTWPALSDEKGWKAKGAEFGVHPKGGESWESFRARVREAAMQGAH